MIHGRRTRRALAAYFVLFLLFLYGPILTMAVLSFQGPQGGTDFPMRGVGLHWWRQLVDGARASQIQEAALRSLELGAATGAIAAALGFGLSLAYRRRYRGERGVFVLVLVALMTPGVLLNFGNALVWRLLGGLPSLWTGALGTSVVWALPFAFLLMVAVWNRYDERLDESARDLGASAARTFRAVTLPLTRWGLIGGFAFGFTLSWNEYDRVALLLRGENTLPRVLVVSSVGRPDMYALGTGTAFVTLLLIALVLALSARSSREL